MEPKVILPADYDVREAAEKCGMHYGIFSCPCCGQMFNNYGHIQVAECTKCRFQFPADWWSVYARGVADGALVAAGGPVSGGMRLRMSNLYYLQGFNCPEGEAWETKNKHDWKTITEGWTPVLCEANDICGPICERCGKLKDEPRRHRSGLCVECEAATECRHRCSQLEKTCKAGVNFKELGKNQLGLSTSLPCYWVSGTLPIHCPSFAPVTVEEVKKEDEEMAQVMARHFTAAPLIHRIRIDHKGKNWKGTEECPVCKGKLHMTHAACNGHVHGQCETEGCLSWME